MTISINKLMCIGLATFGIISCTTQSNVGNLEFESIEKIDSLVLGEAAALRMEFSTSMPVSGDKELISWLNGEFSEIVLGLRDTDLTPKEAINKQAEILKQAYISEVKEYYEEDRKNVENGTASDFSMWYNYEQRMHVAPKLYKWNLLSYEVITYTYSGGAHGYSALNYLVYDLDAKKIILYEDLFNTTSEEALTKLIIEQLKLDYESDDLDETGFWVENIKPSKNFSITEQGILFFYNQYEIAPYVMGGIEVLIPYSKLKGLINAEHPVIKRFI